MKAPDKVLFLYKGSIIIDFFKLPHLYVIRETGERPISVTKVTDVIDKPALKFWSVNLARDFLLNLVRNKKSISEQMIIDASKLHSTFTKKAATIGSLVHEWAEDHIKGKKPPMPIDKKVLNGIMAFLKWIDEHDIKFLASEKIVYSRKYDYVGIMDCKFTMGSEKHKIVHAGDFKTGKAVYPEARFQVSAYQAADEEESGQKYGSKWIIRFDKETGEFHSFEFNDQSKDFRAFVGCLYAQRRLLELKKEAKK